MKIFDRRTKNEQMKGLFDGCHTLTCKPNASKMTTQHGGADFRQIFGQHTAAQISASTRRRRFRPAHGDTDAAPKISRKKKLRAEGPQIFFETVSVEQGFMTKQVCFMTEKVFVLMQPVLHVGEPAVSACDAARYGKNAKK